MRGKDFSSGKKITAVLVSSIVAVLLFSVVYEVLANINYYWWRKELEAKGEDKSALKMATIKSPDPELVWEYRPGAKYQDVEINSYGFRDADHDLKKKEGIYRVAFIGDSVTFGLKEKFPNIFTTCYQNMLKDKNVEVFNIAVDGYDTRQIAQMLKTKVFQFKPDKVIYVMCLNDFDFDDPSSRKRDYFNKPFSFIWRRIQKAPRNIEQLMGKDYHLCFYDINQRAVFKKILEMRDDCVKNGARLELAVVPAFFKQKKPDFETYPLARIHEGVDAFCKANGIPCCDLLAEYRKLKLSPAAMSTDSWHLSAEGHKITAEIFANCFSR